jgi:hypothetical protein
MRKNIVVIVLSLALAVACYLLGWSNVSIRDLQKHEDRGRLGLDLVIYQQLERGEFQRAKANLGLVILGQTRVYEHQYGVPTGTNWFAEKFAKAQTIALLVESNLVPVSSILTNLPHTPDAEVTIEKEKN